LHGAVLLVCSQPTAGLQSSVQGLPSSHAGGGPPVQTPKTQMSAVVHALPSSHGSVFGLLMQPSIVSHESFVHTL
jgi:hypothetical protein